MIITLEVTNEKDRHRIFELTVDFDDVIAVGRDKTTNIPVLILVGGTMYHVLDYTYENLVQYFKESRNPLSMGGPFSSLDQSMFRDLFEDEEDDDD